MKDKKKIVKPWFWGLLLILLITAVVVFLVKLMEGQPPTLELHMDSPSLGVEQVLTLDVADRQSGIRKVWIAVLKDDKEVVLLDKRFPRAGFIAGGQVRQKTIEVKATPKDLGLTDGKAMLRLMVRDYSWRKWGKGNQNYQEQRVLIDTQVPQIQVLSSKHYFAQGGTGLVVYQLSEDCPKSGVMVGDDFYQGFSGHFKDPKIHLAYLALNHQQGPGTRIYIHAEDFAGNQGQTGFAHHVNPRRFKKDKISISDSFLNWKMPEFQNQVANAAVSDPVATFLKVNQELRRANAEKIKTITQQIDERMHWQGAFLQLPKSANRAGFADHRTYTYNGKKIDEQTHLGIDLASVEQSPIPAANNGKVVFAENLGIYGQTIIIDHGFGLFSMYSHLSRIDVSPDDAVTKAQIIGKTGKSGLAGGDHLHFSMLVHYTFVNPLEWWDPSWVQNNIMSKIESIKKEQE